MDMKWLCFIIHKNDYEKGANFVNDFNEHKWPAVIFFVTCGLFFFGCVWYLWAGATNPEYYWQPSEALALESPEPFLEKNECVLLTKNKGVRVNGARVVYRGSRNGALLLDLYVLQLDPHYGYPHKIEEDQARKGFRMGEEHYKVLAASDAKISLQRL
ncbi:hypothetical protein DSCW_03240 [Desulfosarcina widdelii]|uniref:Uncharacterized protein n=1 Tax=Desulfosarcina widdelii TaxID=947919 RepID=A0A5K7Z8W5_9BACT|nr:hypothetical protein DSCW_03240 [Desulfosarcina widdelii]